MRMHFPAAQAMAEFPGYAEKFGCELRKRIDPFGPAAA